MDIIEKLRSLVEQGAVDPVLLQASAIATPLCEIATAHYTDKAPWWWGYTRTYFLWLHERRETIEKVLEIGVLKGASLRTWRDFFPNAMVYGVDNDGSCQVTEERIKTFQCDAYDWGAMAHVMAEIGSVDFFVDDAIHDVPQQTDLLRFMWPYLSHNGIYAIEESDDRNLMTIAMLALSLPDVVRTEIIYSKNEQSLTLLQKGRKNAHD